MKMINYEKKEMIPLTVEENESYGKQKLCYTCKQEFNNDENDKNTKKMLKMNSILMKMKKMKKMIKMNSILTKATKMNLILMKMIKMHLNHTIKSETIVITLENLEELLIVFAI